MALGKQRLTSHAVQAVKDEMSFHDTAEQFDIPKSTIKEKGIQISLLQHWAANCPQPRGGGDDLRYGHTAGAAGVPLH
jgi:hypothetical protein